MQCTKGFLCYFHCAIGETYMGCSCHKLCSISKFQMTSLSDSQLVPHSLGYWFRAVSIFGINSFLFDVSLWWCPFRRLLFHCQWVKDTHTHVHESHYHTINTLVSCLDNSAMRKQLLGCHTKVDWGCENILGSGWDHRLCLGVMSRKAADRPLQIASVVWAGLSSKIGFSLL